MSQSRDRAILGASAVASGVTTQQPVSAAGAAGIHPSGHRELREIGLSQWAAEQELAKPFWRG